MPVGRALRTVVLLGVAVHLHHRFRGAPLDYVGVFTAAWASWAGLPGPGEPVLIAAGVFAARHRLDITSVIVAAWFGATVGGVAGWLAGLKVGRTVAVARGPFQRARIAAVKRGDEVFSRYPVLAILVTPSWVAGIVGVGTRIYMITNGVGAVVWAVGIGLAAFYVGPPAIEFIDDIGTVALIALIVLVALAVVGEVLRRRERRRRKAKAADHSTTAGGTEPMGSQH